MEKLSLQEPLHHSLYDENEHCDGNPERGCKHAPKDDPNFITEANVFLWANLGGYDSVDGIFVWVCLLFIV